MILSVDEYRWLAELLDRRAARYTRNAGRCRIKGRHEALIRRLELEAARSALAASRIRRGLQLEGPLSGTKVTHVLVDGLDLAVAGTEYTVERDEEFSDELPF